MEPGERQGEWFASVTRSTRLYTRLATVGSFVSMSCVTPLVLNRFIPAGCKVVPRSQIYNRRMANMRGKRVLAAVWGLVFRAEGSGFRGVMRRTRL